MVLIDNFKEQLITSIISNPIVYISHFDFGYLDEVLMSIVNTRNDELNILELSKEDIYEFVTKYETDVRAILDSKDFETVNSRIKYCLLMLENQLQHYVLEKEQPKQIEEPTKEVEIDDFDIVVNVEKKEKRRDINDILGL